MVVLDQKYLFSPDLGASPPLRGFFCGSNFVDFRGTLPFFFGKIRKVVFDLLPLSPSSNSMKIMESRIFEPDLMCQMGFLR